MYLENVLLDLRDTVDLVIFANFARRTNSRIQEYRENYYYNSATYYQKWPILQRVLTTCTASTKIQQQYILADSAWAGSNIALAWSKPTSSVCIYWWYKSAIGTVLLIILLHQSNVFV